MEGRVLSQPLRNSWLAASSAPAALSEQTSSTPGIVAASIFVFLESLDEFTGTFFVGAPDVTTLPLLLNNASMSGNYQVSSITALILLAPSLLFMVVIHKFMRPEMMAKLGK